jgi:hypothetical protein
MSSSELNLMARDWVKFNEYENVLASTDLLALAVSQLREQPSNWKWMMLAAHDALQGAMVCAGQNTSCTNILNKQSEKETLDWLDKLEGDEPAQYLADFLTLLKKYRKKYPSSAITADQLNDIRKLHNQFRNNFAHFTPKGWSIEIAMLPKIIGNALNLVEMAMHQHQVTIHLSGNMKRRLAKNLTVTRAGLTDVK